MARFDNVSCSHCGREFGHGEHGYSHCDQHDETTLLGACNAALRFLTSPASSDLEAQRARHDRAVVTLRAAISKPVDPIAASLETMAPTHSAIAKIQST